MTLEPLDLIASAAHYAGRAGAEMAWAEREPESRAEHFAAASVWAQLAQAAATLEAARLTLDAQAANLLSALEEAEDNPDEAELETCGHEWRNDGQQRWPTDVHPKHSCDNIKGHQIKAHVCGCGVTSR